MFVVAVRDTTSVVGSNLVSLEEKQDRPGKQATADDCRCLVGVGRGRLLVELKPRHLAANPRRPPRASVAALEAGRFGILVKLRVPGAVAATVADGVVTPEFNAAWHHTLSIDRMGEPADIAKAVVFLASDYASWIVGTDHLVDGGSHLRGLSDYIGYLLPGQE